MTDPSNAQTLKKVQDTLDASGDSAKFKNNLKEINSIEARPSFRKSYSTLASLSPFIDATLEIPIIPPAREVGFLNRVATGRQEGDREQLGEVDLFKIPYNNIKSLEFGIGTGGEGRLIFNDSSFAFGQALLARLSSQSPGRTPTIKIRYGWNTKDAPSISTRSPRPVYSAVFYALVTKTEVSFENNKETYTLTFRKSTNGPIGGQFQQLFRPFNLLGPLPLGALGFSKVFAFLNQIEGNISGLTPGGVIKFVEDGLKNLNDKSARSNFFNKIKDHYGTLDQESLVVILRGLIKAREIGQPTSNTKDPDSFSKLRDGKEDSLFDLYLSDQISFTGIEGDNPFTSTNAKSKETLSEVSSKIIIAKEERVHPYVALLFLLKQMKIQNEKINEGASALSEGKNKLIILNFLGEDQIQEIDIEGFKKNPSKKITEKEKEEKYLIKISDYVAQMATGWSELLQKAASSISLKTGDSKVKSDELGGSNQTKTGKVTFSTYRKKGSEREDLKSFKDNLDIFLKSVTRFKKDSPELQSTVSKIIKEIDDFISDPAFSQITIVTLTQSDITGNAFTLSNYQNKIVQTYSVYPDKRPRSTIFNSGSERMIDSSFPDVISFNPKLDFAAQNIGQLLVSSVPKGDKEGSADVSAEGNLTNAVSTLINSSRNFFSTRDTISFNSEAYSSAFDSFRVQVAKQMSNLECELKIIGEPALEGLVSDNAHIYLKVYLPNGRLSAYSGLYMIDSVGSKGSIEGSKFSMDLKIRRNTAVNVKGDLLGNATVTEVPEAEVKKADEPKPIPKTKGKNDKTKTDVKTGIAARAEALRKKTK